jgi:membrane-bound lytic murein transglycosylase D
MTNGMGRAVNHTRMKTLPGVLILVAMAACSRGTSAPAMPAPAPAPEEAQAAPPSPPVARPSEQQAPPPALPPQNPTQAAASRDTSVRRDSAAQDTLQREAAFLDSLHTMRADTSRPAVQVPVAPEAVRREAATLLGRPTWDIDVETYASHQRVQYWMTYFTGRSRWHFERYIERAGRYDSMIRTRLAAAGLPQDLLYLALIESGFAQTIRSRAGAVGIWQFIPGTARMYNLTVDAWLDDRRDPFMATDAAIRFLGDLNRRFGSWYLAAAAYNSGPGKIVRGLRRGDYDAMNGNDAFFAMAEGSFLRRETRDYVPKLIAAALLGKEPERYGFTGLTRWTPLEYDSVQVPFAVGLDVVARLAGAPRDSIETMNPRFIRGVTPPDRRVWVKVPVGTADSVAARLAVLPASDRVTVMIHVVSRGETLSSLARRYGVTSSDIKSANRLPSNRLVRNQRLVIPTSLGRTRNLVANEAPRRTTRARATTTSTRATSTRTGTTRATTARSTTRRVHIVRAGESPYSIAQSFGVSLADLQRANNLTRRSVIRPGQSIRIP